MRDLSHRFDGVQALRNLSFQVRRGDALGIIGPNGSGKTTLFNVISRVYPIQSGQVFLKGRPTAALRPEQLAALRLARTFQGPRVFPSLSVLENVIVSLAAASPDGKKPACFLNGFLHTAKSLRAAALGILDFTGLSDFAANIAGTLPYGRKRILDIGRCLALAPEILLLDEPAAGLNGDERAGLSRLIQKLRARGITLLMIEHDMEFIEGICEVALVLNEGVPIASGSPRDVLSDKLVRTAYLGEEVADVEGS